MHHPTATQPARRPATAFQDDRILRSGSLAEVALAVRAAQAASPTRTILVFDDTTGRVIDLDLRGSEAAIVERLSRPSDSPLAASAAGSGEVPASGGAASPQRRGPGRPRLGVVAREVTLLPRHWAWLSSQPGGASATLRRLVEQARRSGSARERRRSAQDAAYRFLLAMAGDRPGFEEAMRALFAGDRNGLETRMASWPEDIRGYALRLAYPETSALAQQGPATIPEETP